MDVSEDEEKDSGIPFWVCMVVTILFGALTAFVAYGMTDKAWRDDCVKHGAAKWTITNDHGVVEWDWIRK